MMKSSIARAVFAAALWTGLAACSSPEEDAGADSGSDRGASCCGMDMTPMMGGPEGEASGMMGADGARGAMMQDMRTIHALLRSHEAVDRTVEDIAGGVLTTTVSDDPEVTALIRRHVREMKARYERGQPIRMMDPVFRELFAHRERATLAYEEIPGGVRVRHTSEDPKVIALIRQHAHRFVSEAAEQGMRRAMRPTPLPEGYAGESG